MKTADKLAARLGANIDESMGAKRGQAGAAGPRPAVTGQGPAVDDRYAGSSRLKKAFSIPVSRIIADPNQPRKTFEAQELSDLADSLRARGQLQPIRVRWDEHLKTWIIVTGERRWRAAGLAGLAELDCVEDAAGKGEAELLEDQLVENCLRADLPPVEQAMAYRKLLDAKGCSVRQLAETLSVSHQSVLRALKLIELPDEVKAEVDGGAIAPSVASELADVPEPAALIEIARKIIDEKLNRNDAVREIRQAREPKAPRAPKGESAAAESPVPIKGPFMAMGRNRLVVEVYSLNGKETPLDLIKVALALREALRQVDGLIVRKREAA